MNRFLLFFIIMMLPVPGQAQNTRKAEKAALKCLDSHLRQAGKNMEYLLFISGQYDSFIAGMQTEAFRDKQQELDSVFTLCGLYENSHLNIPLLRECMEKAYDPGRSKNDTTTSYHQLLEYLVYLSENPVALEEVSPALHLDAVKSCIHEDDRDKDFYKAFSLIFFQGLAHEFDNYARRREDKGGINLSDAECDQPATPEVVQIIDDDIEVVQIIDDDIEVVQIIDDDIEVVQEQEMDVPIAGTEPDQPEEVFMIDDDPEEDQELEIVILKSETDSPEDKFFVIVEKMPEYRGGEEALEKYLKISSETKGSVYVQFIVDAKGRIVRPHVIRGLNPECDQKALKLIEAMPEWIPGEQGGKKVNVQMTYPVRFI